MNRDPDSQAPMTGNIYLDSRFTIRGPLKNPGIDGDIRLSKGSEIYYQLLEDFDLSGSARIVDFSGMMPGMQDSVVLLAGHHQEFIKSSIKTSVEIDPATLLNFRVKRRICDLELDIRGGGSVDYTLLDNNRTYEDVFEGEVMKTGIGYTYRKRYESLSDIFRRKKRKGERP
jgi:hypothetical protein